MHFKLKKFYGLLLAGAMTFTTAFTGYTPAITSAAVESNYTEVVTAVDSESTVVSQALSNGLAEKVEDGVILHCWNWSFDMIKNEMPDIAAAGYTAIQTSPIQMNKDGASGVAGTADWWKFYQPLNFSIGNALGSREQFKAMCDVAHANGVKVIVDVVANHLANVNGEQAEYNVASERNSGIPSNIRDNNEYWHSDRIGGAGDHSRYSMTRGHIGMPDLNTASTGLQDIIISFLNDAQDLGADGFRFDAAKHIETPSDGDISSQFWSRIASATKAKDSDVFLYGEILNTAGPGNYSDVKKYTPYIKVTNNLYGHTVQNSVKDWKASYVKNLHGYNDSGTKIFGDAADGVDWVLWNESHDTFAGQYGDSTRGYSEEQMIYAWCAVAARYPVALYFSRPQSQQVSGGMGVHSNAYKDKRIVEMNFFHNRFAGEDEYASNYENMLVVERGTSGVAIINYDRSGASVNIPMHNVADGEYTDQVSGNTFRVSGGTLSGTIGSNGVAVIYNKTDNKTPRATISKEGGSFSDDTLTLTLGLVNATSGTYKVGSKSAVTFTGTKNITIGDGMEVGDSVTVVLTATDGTQNYSKSYTFTKSGGIDLPDVPEGYKRVFFKNSGNWSTVCCYNWITGSNTSVSQWPGSAMSVCDESNGIYYADVNVTAGYNSIIFNNGNNGSQTDDLTVPTDSKNMFTYGSGWSEYSLPVSKGKVVVKYVDESGAQVADSVTLTGKIGSSYTTTAASVSGYTVTTPSNATGKYTASTITVTYVYSKVSGPTVTSSLASGSSFKTETKSITLTLSNATSGTYKIDNGITKSFTGSTTIKIGEGKIADSDVTVEVTATKGSTTNKKTFTYKKVFNGTVNETTTNAAAVVATDVATATLSNSSLDSQYKTKVATTSKTITVDGNISDWSSDMLIAQGAANDDPRVYRENSMYEVPVDLYALYATYDRSNLYLMWEMTNVQDVVAPNDNYPLTQGFLYSGFTLPIFIAIDTRDNTTKIGNDCKTAKGGTLWDKPITYKKDINRIVATFTDGSKNFIYGGDSTGVNPVELFDNSNSEIVMKWGKGILSTKVMGINGAYGSNNGRVVGDMTKGATYVDFNEKGHDSASMDYHYEMSIPLEKLGTTYSQVSSNGLGIQLVATMGNSGMDCLPYDVTMNDNADLGDAEGSQENNSFEKSDDDVLTVPMGALVKASDAPVIGDELELNFGADRSAPQAAGTALSLLGKPRGGSGTYSKYQYYVNGSLIATKTSQTAVAWTPSSAGKYVIKCVVTDSKGNKVTSSKYFTVEGGAVLTGLQLIDGSLYYYTEAGVMKTDYFYNKDGKRYYFGSDGKAITGLKKCSNGYIYYFQGSKGVATGLKTVSGSIYYFNPSSGAALGDWRTIDGNKYYFDNTTRKGYTGLKTIDGAFYYFTTAGVMKVDYFYNNDGKRYYFGSDGKAITGLKKCSNGYIYYFQGSKGVATGLKTVNGAIYYFNPSSGAALGDWRTVSGNKYYFDNTTRKAYTGLKTIDGAFYYFTTAGVMKTDYFYNNDGKRYYFGSEGKAITGLKKCSNGYIYYFQGSKGVATGLKTINGAIYYFNPNSGAALGDWRTVDGNKYYFDNTTRKAYTGLKTIDGAFYYFTETGVMKTDYFYNKDGKRYYFGSDGKAITGLKKCSNGYIYYFKGANGVATGLKTVSGSIYYFNPNTGAALGGWITVGTNKYYFDPTSRKAYTGVHTIDGKKYTFGSDGILIS